jgi:general stress protein 26
LSESAAASSSRDAAIARVVELLSEADTAMLTTIDGNGRLVSRPMAYVPGAFDGTLWLFADESSPEAQDIAAQPHVNASFAIPARGDWVSLSGAASVVRDDLKAAELWDDRLEAWFVDGLATAGLVLLSIDVDRAESWDGPGSAQTLLGSLRAALTRSADDPLLDTEHHSAEL